MKTKVKNLEFRVIIEQDENGIYVASVPELVGCHTQGKTLDQVRKRIREAIELVLESDKVALKEKFQHPQAPSFLGIENVRISYA